MGRSRHRRRGRIVSFDHSSGSRSSRAGHQSSGLNGHVAKCDALSQFEGNVAWGAVGGGAETLSDPGDEIAGCLPRLPRVRRKNWGETVAVLVAPVALIMKRSFECLIFREVLR